MSTRSNSNDDNILKVRFESRIGLPSDVIGSALVAIDRAWRVFATRHMRGQAAPPLLITEAQNASLTFLLANGASLVELLIEYRDLIAPFYANMVEVERLYAEKRHLQAAVHGRTPEALMKLAQPVAQRIFDRVSVSLLGEDSTLYIEHDNANNIVEGVMPLLNPTEDEQYSGVDLDALFAAEMAEGRFPMSDTWMVSAHYVAGRWHARIQGMERAIAPIENPEDWPRALRNGVSVQGSFQNHGWHRTRLRPRIPDDYISEYQVS